jgi:hypothetical protein
MANPSRTAMSLQLITTTASPVINDGSYRGLCLPARVSTAAERPQRNGVMDDRAGSCGVMFTGEHASNLCGEAPKHLPRYKASQKESALGGTGVYLTRVLRAPCYGRPRSRPACRSSRLSVAKVCERSVAHARGAEQAAAPRLECSDGRDRCAPWQGYRHGEREVALAALAWPMPGRAHRGCSRPQRRAGASCLRRRRPACRPQRPAAHASAARPSH